LPFHLAALLVAASPPTTDLLDPSQPCWITTSNASRQPGEVLYLSGPTGEDDGALRGLQMDGEPPLDNAKFLLYPASSSNTTGTGASSSNATGAASASYFLVGAYESRAGGYYVYLDYDGITQVWPFDPDKPDKQGEWRVIPSEVGPGGETMYFLVSGMASNFPDQMLYVTVGCLWLPECAIGAFLYNATDFSATFTFSVAPPSPPIDFRKVREAHARYLKTNTTFFLIFTCLLVVFSLYFLVWPCLRPKVQKEQLVDGPFVMRRGCLGFCCPDGFVWPLRREAYRRVP